MAIVSESKESMSTREICEQLQEDLLSYFESNSRGKLWENKECRIDINYDKVCDIVVKNLMGSRNDDSTNVLTER